MRNRQAAPWKVGVTHDSTRIVTQNRIQRTQQVAAILEMLWINGNQCGGPMETGPGIPRPSSMLLNGMRHGYAANDQEKTGEHATNQIAQDDQVLLGMLKLRKRVIDGIGPQTEGENALQRAALRERVDQNNDPAYE